MEEKNKNDLEQLNEIEPLVEAEEEIKEEAPKVKRLWLNLLAVGVILGIIIFLVLQLVGDINAVIEIFKNANYWYVLLAVVVMLVYSVVTALSGHSVFVFSGAKINWTNSYLIQSTEMFFNGITPFSIGAAPIQGYYYHKAGASGTQSTTVMLGMFIIYQMIMTILSTFFIIFFGSSINEAFSVVANGGWYVIIIGYSINVLIFVFSVFFSFSAKTSNLLKGLISLVCKIKPLRKKKDKWIESATKFTTNFQEGLRFVFKRKRLFFVSTTLRILSQLLYYSIPIIVVLAVIPSFQVDLFKFWYILGAVLVASTSMMWVPLPGASGGTEAAFVMLLSLPVLGFPDSATIMTIMLLWRFITYYFGMLYGGVNYLILKRRMK